MRILKNKIAQARAAQDRKLSDELTRPSLRKQKQSFPVQKPVKAKTNLVVNTAPHSSNIFRNYGRAICTFIASKVGAPYLFPLLDKEELDKRTFLAYITEIKDNISDLLSFRSILLLRAKGPAEVEAYKRVFKEMSGIFVKYFSVNWIYSGKILQKEAHLKFRFKVLRRINSPDFFISKKGL